MTKKKKKKKKNPAIPSFNTGSAFHRQGFISLSSVCVHLNRSQFAPKIHLICAGFTAAHEAQLGGFDG